MPTESFDLFRDDLGIPHVRAASETALAYGQGWVIAQDRGLQIEAERMRAEGRYADLAGEAGAAWDRFAARERLAATAREIHDALAEPERAWLAAYADGVSAGLLAGGRDAPELAALPHRPWEPWTPIGVFLAAHVLFNGFPSILWRAHVARHLHVPGVPLEQVLGLFSADAGASSGSNAWAVHGSNTSSGSPLVAGDPHRTLELPGPYQQVRLVCTDPAGPYDVLGFAFPGVPGILHFGHAVSAGPDGPGASSVAWGITNAAAHHVEVVSDGADSAGPGGWRLHWPARELSDVGVASWRALLHVRTAYDVADAFGGWVDPVNRVLTADSTGAVLSLTAGKVPAVSSVMPDRALPAAKPADGYADLPAPTPVTQVAVDANERPVTQPPAELDGRPGLGPRDVRPGREAHDLGWSYAPHRAERIRQLLAAAPDLESPETQARIHGDTRDLGAPGLVAHLAADPSDAAARLRAWVAAGAHVDADSTDAALYMRWRDALAHRLAAHRVLAPLHEPHGQDPALAGVLGGFFDVPTAVGAGLARILAAGWLGIDAAAEASAALAAASAALAAASAALAAASAALSQAGAAQSGMTRTAVGPGRATQGGPTWGELHVPDPLLPVPAPVPGPAAPGPAAATSTGGITWAPVSGNNETVRCTGGSPGVAPTAYRGSVARYVWDLADRANSRWGVPFGADGRPGSPHFDDQHATWADARTTPVVTDWDRLHPVDTTLRLLNGPRGQEVWRREFGPDGVITVHMLDPDADADVLHGWFTQPRAAFWGMGEHTRDEVRDTYAFVESLPTHHAYLVRWDGEPVVLVQAYHPEHDPVATAYDVRPGDLGLHFFLGGRGPTARHGSPDDPWTVLGPAMRGFLFAGPGTRRIVGEPDARNEKAVRRMTAMGFTAGEVVRFESPQGPKEARMAYLTREQAL